MKTTKYIIAFLLVVFFAFSVYAQQEENQLYFAMKHTVVPEKIDEYLKVQEQLALACKEHNFPYSYSAWQSTFPDFYFFFPVQDYNSHQEIFNEIWKIIPKVEPGFGKKISQTVESWDNFFLRAIDNLSYYPENKVEDLIYGEWLVKYFKSGEMLTAQNTFKQITEKLKESNAEYPVTRFQGEIGMNGPVIITVFRGKDAADLNAYKNKTWEDYGEESQKLIQDLNPITRKIEIIPFWHQKKLSYAPE